MRQPIANLRERFDGKAVGIFSIIFGGPRTLLGRFARRVCGPVPPGLWLVNFCFQRVLRINGRVPWMVHFTSRVVGNVEIGKDVWISFAVSGGCYIQGGNGVRIGDETIFAPNVMIISANHSKGDLDRWESTRPIEIGRRCWIGANAVILPGTKLGDDVIVGAGAVVTKSFPNGTVLGGVPARPLN